MQLTRMIFDYWLSHITIPDNSFFEDRGEEGEGLYWYDGYNASFWYLLNVEWYRMQNKQFAKTNCDMTYCEINDFDPEYLAEFYP